MEPAPESIKHQFGGKGWQQIKTVEDFVKSDAVSFHSGQLRKHALVPMENAGEVEVKEDTRSRPHSFPAGKAILRFL